MDIDQERANAAVAAACDGARVFADADDLIADPDVDAILIASTDRTHADITIACIEAGKPVLCEKPLATTVADAERVLRAELATGRRLVQVGFMREYDQAHKDLYDLLHSGVIGAALKFRSLHVNPRFVRELTIDSVITNSLDPRYSLGALDHGRRDLQRLCAVGAGQTPPSPRSARSGRYSADIRRAAPSAAWNTTAIPATATK